MWHVPQVACHVAGGENNANQVDQCITLISTWNTNAKLVEIWTSTDTQRGVQPKRTEPQCPVGSVAIILHIRNVDRMEQLPTLCVWAALVKEIIINY